MEHRSMYKTLDGNTLGNSAATASSNDLSW